MGNVDANAEGNAIFHLEDHLITLFGAYSVLGRSCVLHMDEDDLADNELGLVVQEFEEISRSGRGSSPTGRGEKEFPRKANTQEESPCDRCQRRGEG